MSASSTPLMGPLGKLLHLPTDEAAVKAACIELVRQYCKWRAPISLRPILDAFRIKVSRCNIAGDAMLVLSGSGHVEIRLNTALPRLRNRFSIAHEIAHLVVMNLSKRASSDCLLLPQNHRSLERLCDLGAKEILMPNSLFLPALQSAGFTRNGLTTLVAAFEASRSAVLRRIAEVIPGVVLLLVSPDRQVEIYNSRIVYENLDNRFTGNCHAKGLMHSSRFEEFLSECNRHPGVYSEFEINSSDSTKTPVQCMALKLVDLNKQSEFMLPGFSSCEDNQRVDAHEYAILCLPHELAKHECVWQRLKRNSTLRHFVL